ncbi:MAG TPA: HpcH/HpaI aldolase/citrate lyase family protein [Afifellaceae bacterium]|nr:HpcH/HpaI aldolase/citrate lyase family protein [Afifellaceae bacterium]
MELPRNTFKQAIARGDKQIGLWNSLCSNIAADILAPAGYDWVLLDMEHSPSDLRTVLGQLQAYQAYGTVAAVRPTWNDPVLVKPLLDMGATTFLFPMVQSAEEAQKAVASTRYPPRGNRGVSLSQRGNRFGRITDYVAKVEEEICVLVQIETRQALSRVGEIAAVEGVDGVFFGPADLSADMGIIGQLGHEDLWAAIAEGVAAAARMGKPSGTLVGDPDKAIELFGKGFSYVACGSDINLLARGADALLSKVRNGI